MDQIPLLENRMPFRPPLLIRHVINFHQAHAAISIRVGKNRGVVAWREGEEDCCLEGIARREPDRLQSGCIRVLLPVIILGDGDPRAVEDRERRIRPSVCN